MRARLLGLWESLRTSFWFVPILMILAAIGLSAGTVTLDGLLGQKVAESVGWIWSGGADGARALLSTVASSMITVAGTVFSITIAALTLASSQFGPRLLRNFTRDTGNQVVLGTFVSTYLYCLLVLRTVRSQGEGGFIPYISVTCGTLLAVASIGVLVYFIHHVAGSIQAESLIAAVGRELRQDIIRLCPPAPGGPEARAAPVLPDSPGHAVPATASGYIQQIDRDGMAALAAEHDLLVQVLLRPGDFVPSGEALLRVWSPRGRLDAELSERLLAAFSVGMRRTPTQDVRYGVQQLTEIAARALSPGINDPFTAVGCVDWLTDALGEMAGRDEPPAIRRGDGGGPRLVEQPVDFAELARLSFEPLRAYGSDSALVTAHVLRAIARLAARVPRPGQRAALLREAELTEAAARLALRAEADLRRVLDGLGEVREALAGSGPPAGQEAGAEGSRRGA